MERTAKSGLLVLGAVTLLVLGHEQVLSRWAAAAQDQLNLDAPSGLFQRLIDQLLVRIGFYRHLTALALGITAYALLEGTEAVGLAMRRRWAEYLTVLATGILIPYEVWEVLHRATLLRAGGLLVNVAVVGYLGHRKRLFLDV